MTRQYHYTILLHEDDEQGGYWVTGPALPGILTQGDTLEQAITNAREAISLHIQGMVADGEPVPEDEERTQAVTIAVDAPAA